MLQLINKYYRRKSLKEMSKDSLYENTYRSLSKSQKVINLKSIMSNILNRDKRYNYVLSSVKKTEDQLLKLKAEVLANRKELGSYAELPVSLETRTIVLLENNPETEDIREKVMKKSRKLSLQSWLQNRRRSLLYIYLSVRT